MQSSLYLCPRKIPQLFTPHHAKNSPNMGTNQLRQSALTFLEIQHQKINNRYGQILHPKILNTSVRQTTQQKQKQNNDHDSNPPKPSKIVFLLEKNQKNKRSLENKTALSLQKKRENSPYLSLQKKIRQTRDGWKINFNKNITNNNSMPKIKYSKKQSLQNFLDCPLPYLQSKQQIHTKKANILQLFTHYALFFKLDTSLLLKSKQKQTITLIRTFILTNSSHHFSIDNLDINDKDCEQINKIHFLQQLFVILIVDLIINLKYKAAEHLIKNSLKLLTTFYTILYHELNTTNNLAKSDFSHLQPSAINKLLECQNDPSIFTQNFNYISGCLSNRIQSCFKYSKSLLNYYLIHETKTNSTNSNGSYFSLLEHYSQVLLTSTWSNWNIDFLLTCPSPYLHHQPTKKLTLALDLDQTLIHYKTSKNNSFQGEFMIRPYMFQFLEQMAMYFELGIFTCSMQEYADLIINRMKYIEFRLYRHHTVRIKGEYVKDLSRIGRNLNSLILLDNIQQNYRLQKQNGITIRSWYGNPNDNLLQMVGNELKKLAMMDVDDVRQTQFERKFL